MSDYTELQKAAEYAAQDTIKFADEDEEMRALQQFHEEVSPETVLGLIADLDEARNGMKHSCAIRLKKEIERLESEAMYSAGGFDAAREEIARLKAEVAGLRTGYEAYERVNAEMKAENEALRKDADKWQIVERAMTQLQSDEQGAAIWSACSRILISVAGKLNSAHSTVTEEGVTFDGVEAGDWRVTVERIDAAMGKGEQP